MTQNTASDQARELAVRIIFKETSSNADFNLTYDNIYHYKDDADKIAGIAQPYFDAVRKAALEEAAIVANAHECGGDDDILCQHQNCGLCICEAIRALIDQPAAATQVSDEKDAEIKRLREASMAITKALDHYWLMMCQKKEEALGNVTIAVYDAQTQLKQALAAQPSATRSPAPRSPYNPNSNTVE